MRQFRVFCALLLGTLLCGCERLQYQSVSPSARSFHEDPGVDEMYFGADAQFAITDRRQQRYLVSTALPTQVNTLDAWNPVVAWDQMPTPAAPATEQASTDEPAPSDD
jgi:hypothetical protein